jgi:Fic family protein
MLNKLMGGFEGKFTSSKRAKITKAFRESALRDIQDLINHRILEKGAGVNSTF